MTRGLVAPTEGQEEEFKNMIDAARRRAGLDKETMQRLIGNGGKFQEGVIALLAKLSVFDDRFELLSTFKLTVPEGYDHGTQLATFRSKADLHYYNDAITDANFARVSNKLVPGKTYLVKIFGIKTRVTSEECLAFLNSQGGILVGAQGLSLVQQLKKEQFPAEYWVASFDKKEALWFDGAGHYYVPLLRGRLSGTWLFDYGNFEWSWSNGIYLVCFCDLPVVVEQ